jgi:hypothetical protein
VTAHNRPAPWAEHTPPPHHLGRTLWRVWCVLWAIFWGLPALILPISGLAAVANGDPEGWGGLLFLPLFIPCVLSLFAMAIFGRREVYNVQHLTVTPPANHPGGLQ